MVKFNIKFLLFLIVVAALSAKSLKTFKDINELENAIVDTKLKLNRGGLRSEDLTPAPSKNLLSEEIAAKEKHFDDLVHALKQTDHSIQSWVTDHQQLEIRDPNAVSVKTIPYSRTSMLDDGVTRNFQFRIHVPETRKIDLLLDSYLKSNLPPEIKKKFASHKPKRVPLPSGNSHIELVYSESPNNKTGLLEVLVDDESIIAITLALRDIRAARGLHVEDLFAAQEDFPIGKPLPRMAEFVPGGSLAISRLRLIERKENE